MSDNRRPASFRLDPEPETEREIGRLPRALRLDEAEIEAADPFAEADAAALPPRLGEPHGRSWLVKGFIAGAGALASLALGLWVDGLIRELFAREPWLGWVGVGAAGLAATALLAVLGREMLALARLASVEAMRRRGEEAIVRDDAKAARAVVAELTAFLAAKGETAAGRRALAGLDGDIVDGAALVRLAEAELLAPLDAQARAMILDAAKRVSLVTAVSPRAFFDVAYVVFEAGRLVRRLSELYGGRPGTLGFFRLARSALAHLAVTGSIAAGDSVVQQIVGHGLAARLSAKLGEGVVNGMMTARIGIAAMEAARPLPFVALKRPGVGDFLAALANFAAADRAAGEAARPGSR
jgi:putative membrane protein